MKNRFNKEDIVYSIDVNKHLIISVNKLIVKNFFFNDIPQYKEFIYTCTGLEQVVIRDYELSIEEEEKKEDSVFNSYRSDRNPGATASGSFYEKCLYFKEEVEHILNYAGLTPRRPIIITNWFSYGYSLICQKFILSLNWLYLIDFTITSGRNY